MLDPDFSDTEWVVKTAATLFEPSRPIKTILAVAEALEELKKAGAVDLALADYLEGGKRQVVESCNAELEALRSTAQCDLGEELEYIIATIDSVLQSPINA